LSWSDIVDPRPAWPPKPALPAESDPDFAGALTELCAGLRDVRQMLPPLTAQEVSGDVPGRWPGDQLLAYGCRQAVAGWPELRPHLTCWAPTWQAVPVPMVARCWRRRRQASRRSVTCAHPYHWAPYVLIGR
jgi:hypothetical protein